MKKRDALRLIDLYSKIALDSLNDARRCMPNGWTEGNASGRGSAWCMAAGFLAQELKIATSTFDRPKKQAVAA